jgi:hypothetical protein
MRPFGRNLLELQPHGALVAPEFPPPLFWRSSAAVFVAKAPVSLPSAESHQKVRILPLRGQI